MPKNTQKVWFSANDNCCCPLCSKLEGVSLNIDEAFEIDGHSVLFPPLHEGCRCGLIFIEKNKKP